MTTPASDQNETSRMKKLLNGSVVDESIKSRLPRGNGVKPAMPPPSAPMPDAPIPATVVQSVTPSSSWRFKLLPAFWTIASIMSISVNIVLLAALLIALQMLGATRCGRAGSLCRGLGNRSLRRD